MPPADCPRWEYNTNPISRFILRRRSTRILIGCHRQIYSTSELSDTKKLHRLMFRSLTPKGHPYFAGNYRGADFRCLRDYEVEVRRGAIVDLSGTEAVYVSSAMNFFSQEISDSLSAMTTGSGAVSSLDKAKKRAILISFVCRVLVDFLSIHPYANGNGHMSRILVIIILTMFRVIPAKWSLTERPSDPPFGTFLTEYRTGNKLPLESFIGSQVFPD